MKRIASLAAWSVVLAGSAVWADDASKKQKIEEIFNVMNMEQTMKAMQGQTRAAMQAQFEQMGVPNAKAIAADMDKVMAPLVEEALSPAKMRPMMIQVYDETFTEQEVSGILDFYKSPAGRAMLDKMPTLMSKSMAISQNMMKDLMPKLMKELPKIMEKYNHGGEMPPPPPADKTK